MPVITEEYRVQQAALHAACPEYGVASAFFAPAVARIVKDQGVTELLDYGAGKGRLGRELARLLGEACPPMRHYEPAVPEWASAPAPADMVACIDVLEHVEMDCLDDVLEDLARVTARLGLFTVHTGPAIKTLPDGRNAHLIQQPAGWWLTRLFRHFTLTTLLRIPNGFMVVAVPDGASVEPATATARDRDGMSRESPAR